MSIDTVERVLLKKLEEACSPQLYTYAKGELDTFYARCYEQFDERAAHTDREGQPRLIRYDRYGNDVSQVWVNEGYKKTVEETYNTGIVGYVHKPIPKLGSTGNYSYSFAQGYVLSQVEPGFYCPVTLTMAVAYLIDHYADETIKQRFLPHVLATGDVELYEGATFLTERQGGSDVGANEVRAVKEGDHYRIYGEKYFASNAGQCGVAAVLARCDDAPPGSKGLSLFLVPWKDENGSINKLYVRRLKDKLGVRAVPSGEVMFEGAKAYLIGEADQGFYYMMEALNLSRICNSVASLGIMKRALVEVKSYTLSRKSFKQRLIDFPMIQESIAKLYARQEIQLSAVFDSIVVYDEVTHKGNGDPYLNRLLIALLKARTAEEAIAFSHEAIEIHGGNGYIEDFVTSRLLRDAQVLTVWEGTENILALEVLRLITNYEGEARFFKEINRQLTKAKLQMSDHVFADVEQHIQGLTADFAYLSSCNKEEQTLHVRLISRKMVDLLLVVHGYARIEDHRDHVLANIYRKTIWHSNTLDKEKLATQFIEEIIREKDAVLSTSDKSTS
ncbi:acyl-CoA dehydrogenase family protein [Geomicrobium sediminis]|uniref:Alkylation response protein AidB-like acyl-CoA dehydrogenase n=1 Tax=Geomicrobium sediminis TaxID=1347788 RepID=A0ABS2PHQ0_9BACL|nr:acyl-CoA dehydrogenase family protein [Geomicrobium sediminis]MBM7634969.1 alkylation response protein AidB-like acyl-CoA dehydrogenase [Geomicrobium sediminis]